MHTTQQLIEDWFSRKPENATHMIVVCDTYDWEDYPVYVYKGQDSREIAKKYDGKNMQKLMEVYSYSKNLEEQLNQHRCFNYD